MDARDVQALLLGLRAAGFEEIDDSGRLHRALAALLATGVVPPPRPVPHPLFGYYREVEDAIEDLHRSGVVDYVLGKGRLLFGIDGPAARRLADKWSPGAEVMKAFVEQYRRVVQGS